MKQSRLVAILLVMLMVVGWLSVLAGGSGPDMEAYEACLADAGEFESRGLYQRAAEEYGKALEIQSSEEIQTAQLAAYKQCYQQTSEAYNDYMRALNSAVTLYNNNKTYLKDLVELHLADENYSTAYRVLQRAIDAGMDDPEMKELLLRVRYSYELYWKTYAGFRSLSEGFYAVNENGVWTYIKPDGNGTDYENLLLAGPVGQDGTRLIQDFEETRLESGKGMILGFPDFEPQDAGVYWDGLIPVFDGKSWFYCDSLCDRVFGDYEAAGRFLNGEAAVKQNGQWSLVDSKGQAVTDQHYEDIVLQADRTHRKDGLMIAKQDGAYHFYTKKETVGSYQDADILTDDNAIAVKINGKWGFVDKTGKELLAPAYVEAKSFSCGLAAVSDGKLWGFIDRSGNLVIDYQFKDADYFNESGCCMVCNEADLWQLLELELTY